MKYSQYIGVLFILAFGAVSFLPWIYQPLLNAEVRGMGGPETTFGRVALFNFICCGFSIVFFLIPRVWAKRANLFFTTMNLAWAIKNFITLSLCQMGECPERHAALYIQLFLALGILVMSFLPKMAIPEPKSE